MIDTDSSLPPSIPVKDRHVRAILWIGRSTAALVALLALAAFALSFEALRDLAVVTGAIPNPQHAWLFPVLLDGGVVVFSLAALRASLTGGDRRWYMTLVVVVTLLSVAFNITHAARGFLPAVMAGMPPLLLFMAFESLMRQIQDSLKPLAAPKRKSGIQSSKKMIPVDVSAAEKRARIAPLREEGWSNRRIAQELQMSPTTVARYLRKTPIPPTQASPELQP